MNQKTNLTIGDIARHLGVSKTTVSRCLSGKGRISEATRQRVLDYVQKSNYRPSASAKALAENRTYNLALALPRSYLQLDMPYLRQSLNAICEEAFLRDYNILLCLYTEHNPAILKRTLDSRKVDGVILARTVENDILVDWLNQQEIPFATMGSLAPSVRGMAVVEADHDHICGCYAFARCFLTQGSGPVAVLGNDMKYIVNQSRLTGIQLAKSELQIPDEQIHLQLGIQTQEACQAAVGSLLSQGIRRFLAMDDDICMWIIHSVNETERSNIQLASLYDSELLQTCQPPVPALKFDAAALGRAACRELLHYLFRESYDPAPILGYEINMRSK